MASSPYSFTCPHCQRTLRSAVDVRGRRVRCPGCQEAFRVPRPEPAHEGGLRLMVEEHEREKKKDEDAPTLRGRTLPCVSCGERVAVDDLVCTHCGTNQKTGRRLLTKVRGRAGLEAEDIRGWVTGVSLILPLAIVPYKSTVTQGRSRLANTILVAATCIISIIAFVSLIGGNEAVLTKYALWPGDSFAVTQLVTHVFLHGGIGHLAGNMVFMWMFGATLCSTIGWHWYTGIYLALGALAGLVGHVILGPADGLPLVGASGAICGLTGLYLVLFPRHDVHMAIWFRIAWWMRPWIKTFAVTGIYVVCFFTAFDVAAIALGWTGNVAHAVHLSGFAAGILLGIVLLLTGAVKTQGYDLLTWVLGDKWRSHG